MIPGRMTEQDGQEREIVIPAGEVMLGGTLHLPRETRGIVLFAHGSGSSRHSPRNRYVAGVLQSRGIATLLFDLLTRGEEFVDERTEQLRFDIGLLARRLCAVTESVRSDPDLGRLPVGYFGASTGAAAALVAAAELPETIAAVVSRGGRPDMAVQALRRVQAPTLLIVGGEDKQVIQWNRKALAQLRCPEKELIVIPGATHLFEEPGALEEVARLAGAWFERFLASVSDPIPAADTGSSHARRAS
jgi:pimeloyl-ACP methyl ester carboxylesterase